MQVLHLCLSLHSEAPKLHIGYFEVTLHVGIVLKLDLHIRLLKSPMDYLEMSLNMGIAFKARYSYNFAIHAHVLTSTNWKFGLNFLNN
jgi:hypothetical protein